VLVFNGERVFLSGEVDPEWLHDGTAGGLGVVEESVPVGQETVAGAHGLTHGSQVLRGQQPRLPAPRVQVGVGTEEGLIGSRLHNTRAISQLPST